MGGGALAAGRARTAVAVACLAQKKGRHYTSGVCIMPRAHTSAARCCHCCRSGGSEEERKALEALEAEAQAIKKMAPEERVARLAVRAEGPRVHGVGSSAQCVCDSV